MNKVNKKLAYYKQLREKIKAREQKLNDLLKEERLAKKLHEDKMNNLHKEERRARKLLKMIESKKEKALTERPILIKRTPLEMIQEDVDDVRKF